MTTFTSPKLVQEFLELSAERFPEKIALVCCEQRYTYKELDRKANAIARALRDLGIRRGDRVCISLHNTYEAVVSIFGVLKAGAVFVPLHPTTKEGKLHYILQDCQAKILFADPLADIANIVSAGNSSASAPIKFVICGPGAMAKVKQLDNCIAFESLISGHGDAPLERSNIDLDLACLIYTSGSTGEPKGVMSDHSNVVFAAASIISLIGNTESDVILSTLPLSFDYGLYQLLMAFCFGGTLVLERSFAYPAATLKKAESEGVTGLPGVPTIFAMLLKMDLSSFDLSRIRYLTNTAAALPPSHIRALGKAFPNTTIFSMYGLTETKRTLYLPPEDLEKKTDSVGIAIPGTETWLEDEKGNHLPYGSQGELVIRGRHVMRGYWNSPDITAKRFRPGPLPNERICYSGDLFRTDEDGYFYFVARQDDIIKSRGEKVAPKEVENAIYALPGIVEAAVIGVHDEILGEAVKAFVVTEGKSISEKEILAHCRTQLEEHMIPTSIEFRDALPKSKNGKIVKKLLIQSEQSH